LGIRSSLVYNHVKGLKDVRKHLGIYRIQQLHNKLEEAAEDKRIDEAIHALGQAYVAFVRKHPGLYEATYLRDEEVRKATEGIVK
ncbi:TetR-like C-terminal domain-containing protein, partial [Bacillus velezensis]|uniref:TetR-like C-terminal domain-containing protein n=1 Tax=Bacillus velezensis TaxID=492670 RepID=UPI0020C091BA